MPNASASKPTSVIDPLGWESSDCGYCSSNTSSGLKFFAQCQTLAPVDYKKLIDRGWRRSGCLLYKPDNVNSCCPHYTIRLPVSEFKPRRDQRQACHRWNRYVLGEDHADKVAATSLRPKDERRLKPSDSFSLAEAIHAAEIDYLDKSVAPLRQFAVSLEADTFTAEKFQLFRNYQIHVHKDPPGRISEGSFSRFLCKSPLQRSEYSLNGVSQTLGSFHQLYRLDGRLIAMGVVDIVPDCISGVYFMYHSDFQAYSLGKLSALREALLAQERQLEYYYMGYFINNCPKMRYKIDYSPQYVLDLDNLQWDPINSSMLQYMQRHKFVVLSVLKSRSDDENKPIAELEKSDDGDDPMVHAIRCFQELRCLVDLGLEAFHFSD